MDASDQADPLTADVFAILQAIYGGYLEGDVRAIDRHLAVEITMFDSDAPELVTGRDGLARLRAARSGGTPPTSQLEGFNETALTVTDLAARAVGGVVVASWWLRVDGTDVAGEPAIPELSRNTAVLMPSSSGELLIAHLHEDVWQRLGGPAAARTPSIAIA